MARTFVRQEQILSSSVYDDTLAFGVALQTAASSSQDDFNALRSQVKRLGGLTNWYDDVVGRDISELDTDLDELENQTLLFRQQVFVDIPVDPGANFVVLAVSASEAPGQNAAVGAVATTGSVAASGSIGFHSLEIVSGTLNPQLRPLNLVLIRSSSTGEVIQTSGSKDIYGLMVTEAADGATYDDTTSQVQISFVMENDTRDALEAVPVSDIAGNSIHYSYPRRITLDDLPEDAYLRGVFVDLPDPVGASGVTLDNAIDNQVGPATQTQDIEVRISDEFSWEFQDSTGGRSLLMVSASAGEDSVRVDADFFQADVTNFDINNTNTADFLNGAAFDTGGTTINVGDTAGQIDSAAELRLASLGANDVVLSSSQNIEFFDDNVSGSTYGIPFLLASASSHFDDFETNFGEVSLIEALNDAYTFASSSGLPRTKAVAIVDVLSIAADSNVNDAGGLDANLADYTDKDFLNDVNVYLNGVLLRNGADASANHDVYPGTSPATGDLRFEFVLRGRDVITMEVF